MLRSQIPRQNFACTLILKGTADEMKAGTHCCNVELVRNVYPFLTVLVGDFNLNPYDKGMTSAFALHGVMTRELARKNRTVQGRIYKRFYNPMWKQFKPPDENSPPGTLYFDSGPGTHFWHIFDQVLLRPALLSGFQDDELAILTRAGTHSLVSRFGIPRRNDFSDHLPILFKLTLEENTTDDHL